MIWRAPAGEFLVYDDGFRSRSYTYGEVGDAARGFAARLRDGAGSQRRQGRLLQRKPARVDVAFWGCLLIGVVVVPIDYRASPDFLARVARIVAAQTGPHRSGRAAVAIPVGAPVWRLHELEWTRPATRAARVAIGRDDVAEIIFTSGATADPKGVVITHRNILANIVPVEREVLKYRKWAKPFFPLRFLNLLPLSHMFGQAMATFIPPMLPGVGGLHARLQPGRDRRADQDAARVGAGLGAEDSRRAARARALRDGAARRGDAGAPKQHVAQRWWRYRHVHRLFGLKFWASSSAPRRSTPSSRRSGASSGSS